MPHNREDTSIFACNTPIMFTYALSGGSACLMPLEIVGNRTARQMRMRCGHPVIGTERVTFLVPVLDNTLP